MGEQFLSPSRWHWFTPLCEFEGYRLTHHPGGPQGCLPCPCHPPLCGSWDPHSTCKYRNEGHGEEFGDPAAPPGGLRGHMSHLLVETGKPGWELAGSERADTGTRAGGHRDQSRPAGPFPARREAGQLLEEGADPLRPHPVPGSTTPAPLLLYLRPWQYQQWGTDSALASPPGSPSRPSPASSRCQPFLFKQNRAISPLSAVLSVQRASVLPRASETLRAPTAFSLGWVASKCSLGFRGQRLCRGSGHSAQGSEG